LAAPRDGGTIDKLIEDTNTGICSSNKEELVQFLKQHYEYWKTGGENHLYPNWNEITNYSRESQTKRYAKLMSSVL
jgi:hypothetical protein